MLRAARPLARSGMVSHGSLGALQNLGLQVVQSNPAVLCGPAARFQRGLSIHADGVQGAGSSLDPGPLAGFQLWVLGESGLSIVGLFADSDFVDVFACQGRFRGRRLQPCSWKACLCRSSDTPCPNKTCVKENPSHSLSQDKWDSTMIHRW